MLSGNPIFNCTSGTSSNPVHLVLDLHLQASLSTHYLRMYEKAELDMGRSEMEMKEVKETT